jgi:hypothetical protein
MPGAPLRHPSAVTTAPSEGGVPALGIADSATAAPPGSIVLTNTLSQAAPLVAAGLAGLSRGVVAAVSAQLEAPVGELRTLERLHTLASAQYAEVRDTVAELGAFHEARDALTAALAPQLAALGELEGAVAELGGAARELDAQTAQLEALFTELL